MKVFLHHLYEYRKGLRSLVLHTLPGSRRECVEEKLTKESIAHKVCDLANGNINVFFGADECVAVIEAIGKSRLSDYTPEEDFILGTMLGYDRRQQCVRYIRLRQKQAHADSQPRESRSEELDIPAAGLKLVAGGAHG
ncbi:MAG: DUF2023 family protein [Phycisphaerae bacterium]